LQLWERGRISDDAMHSMVAQIDASLVELDSREDSAGRRSSGDVMEDDDAPASGSAHAVPSEADDSRYNSSP
ncbi:MAG TPA: hypothetical protein VKU87_06155, partial [Thermomicrobiaceae bacterium]|nr:hypothetical protein [Thermomicrobiaceae bacterium]